MQVNLGLLLTSTCHYYLKESLERNTSDVYLAPTTSWQLQQQVTALHTNQPLAQ